MSITGCEFRSATFSGVVTSVVKFIGLASPHWTLERKRRALDNASAETHHVLSDWLREAFKLLGACETVAVSMSNTKRWTTHRRRDGGVKLSRENKGLYSSTGV